jgi:hypothetical protein
MNEYKQLHIGYFSFYHLWRARNHATLAVFLLVFILSSSDYCFDSLILNIVHLNKVCKT